MFFYDGNRYEENIEEEEPVYDQIDQRTGKRYRRVGNCIEYEPETYICGSSVPVRQAKAIREQLKRDEELQRKRDLEAQLRKPVRICPFKVMRNLIHDECKEDCTMYKGGSCLLANGSEDPESNGKQCFLNSRECSKTCMLNNNGCVLATRKE